MLAITKKNYIYARTGFLKIFNRIFCVLFFPVFLTFNFINIPILNVNNYYLSILDFKYSTEIIFLLLILSFTLFAIVKVNFPIYITNIIKYSFRFNTNSKKIISNFQPFLLINLVFIINSSFIILLYIDFLKYKLLSINPIISYLLILSLFSAFYLSKNLLYRLISALFLHKEYIKDYLNNTYIYNQFIGILLLPFIVSIPFIGFTGAKILIYTVCTLIVIILMLRYVNGIKILVRKGISIFYLFLYFCILEIIPYFIIYKLIFNYI